MFVCMYVFQYIIQQYDLYIHVCMYVCKSAALILIKTLLYAIMHS